MTEEDATAVVASDSPPSATTDLCTSTQVENPPAQQAVSSGDDDVLEEESTVYVISLPNGKQITQPMVNTQLVQELVQVLSDRIETCHETCFALCDSESRNKIDNFAELKTISTNLFLQEEPYTARHARQHVLHVYELARPSEEDLYDGFVGNSPSAVEFVCANPPSTLQLPDEFLLPGNEEDVTIDALCPTIETPDPCLVELSFGRWNPPPDSRRLSGDLLYVRVHTLENRILHITVCPSGFYVNQSTDELFAPQQQQSNRATQGQIFHSLVTLLQNCSAQFKRRWTRMLEHKFSQSPLIRIPTPFPVFNWFRDSNYHHQPDLLRSSAHCHQMGLINEMTMSSISPIGQLRDWNEEIQITRQSIHDDFTAEKLPAHRAAFRVHCDFVSSAARTVKGVVDGQVTAINPSEDWSLQIFIWNNLFVSMAFDVRDHYKEYGGDVAAHYAAKSDLRGIERLINVPCDSLSTVGTIVADFMGYRIAVQSIVPGILEKEQEQSIAYGSADFGQTFVFNEDYHKKIMKLGKQLKLKPHVIETKRIKYVDPPATPFRADDAEETQVKEESLTNGGGSEVEGTERVNVVMPIELKGIVGNDNRSYVLDLIRMTPPDLNYLDSDKRKCPHKLLSLRPEFVDQNVEDNCGGYVVNLEQPRVNVVDASGEIDRLREFCELVITKAIPCTLVKLIEEEEPLDGGHLTRLMHKSGVNVRYLADVIRECQKREDLKYVSGIATAEVICRSAKHVFNRQSREILRPGSTCPYNSFVAHFLNCFVGFNQVKRHSQRHKKSGSSKTSGGDPLSQITEKSVWAKIRQDALTFYNFELGDEDCDYRKVTETYGLSRVGLLRRFNQMTGIQLCLQDGKLWSNQGFTPAHVSTVNPVICHVPPVIPGPLRAMIDEAERCFKDGELQKCYLLGSRAHCAIVSLYGPIHELVARCLRLLAKVNFVCNDASEAFVLQQRATLISERLSGLDGATVAYDYFVLSHYCFLATIDSECQLAVKLMFRARHIASVVVPLVGQLLLSHPRIMRIDANLALMLQSAGAHQLAAVFSQSLIARNGIDLKPLDKAAFCNINARVHSCLGKFKQALANERITFTIYRKELGEEHLKTIQSEGLMKHLTEQAVLLEKKMRTEGFKQALFVQAPSKSSVVDLMNAMNGIEILPNFLTSSKELAVLRRLLSFTADKENESANLSQSCQA